jgi:hypothetical protein
LHSVIQFFCWVGKDSFNLINAIVFTALPILITRITKSKNLELVVIFTAIIWFFVPVPGETVFWLSGAVNYLWPTTCLIVYIHLYSNISTTTGRV